MLLLWYSDSSIEYDDANCFSYFSFLFVGLMLNSTFIKVTGIIIHHYFSKYLMHIQIALNFVNICPANIYHAEK